MNGRQITGLGLIALCALVFALTFEHRPVAIQETQGIASSTPAASSTQQFEIHSSNRSQTVATSTAVVSREHRSDVIGNAQPPPSSAPAPVPTSSMPAATAPQPTVTVTIIDPDGSSTFAVGLKAGADACDVLAEAKTEGKLRSLTLDDSYKSTFGSSYVREINGYSNNWTFTVGGASTKVGASKQPEGCSLYKPQAGDFFVWLFGGSS